MSFPNQNYAIIISYDFENEEQRMKLTEKEMLTTMLEMQQTLNDETNGEGWESGYNKYGKIISWKRCIYMECAELIDSFAWKHWKNRAIALYRIS